MKIIVTIIVYNRLENVKTWLRCWPLCNQHGATLTILHTGDYRDDCRKMCEDAGVNYVPRQNRGLDIGCVQDVFKERLEGFPNDWDYMLWITDDVIPMHRDFLTPYISAMQNPIIGCACMMISHTPLTHVRTVAYMIGKQTSKAIEFIADPITEKEQGYFYEYKGGSKTLTKQISKMGLKSVQVEPNETAGLWDTGYGKRLERMKEHYDNFPVPAKSTVIHHFYHIYADGSWQEPIEEHIKALKMGLLPQLTTFNIGIVGHPRNRRQVKQYLVEQGIYFNIVAQTNTGWEQVTQIPMHTFALHNEGIVLYAHTKGAANVSDTNTKWRRSMTYYNVIQWQIAVQKLNEGYDAVGQHWMFPSHHSPEHKGWPFFGGTFWWTTLAHIRSLGAPSLEHRHIAEGWIGEQYYNKPMKCFDFTGHISAHPCHSLWKHDWV